MKIRHVIILLVLLGIVGLIVGCGDAPTGEKAGKEGTTSFEGHSEGKYGPEGSGGYGSPVPGKPDESTKEKAAKKGAAIQDVREGTSFQGHSEGKYGPEGSGGYGSPVPGK